MAVRTIYHSLSTGLVSEEFARRSDVARQRAAMLANENFIVTSTGAATLRPGTLHIANAGNNTAVQLHHYTFSQEQAYMLEFGPGYIRVYRDLAYLGVQVATPYTAADLPGLHFDQLADVLTIHHLRHPQAEFFRVTDTDWRYRAITFRPPPVEEIDTILGGTLTLSALSGSITMTTSGQPFLEGDVGRILVAFAGGSASITDITTLPSSQSVTGFVLDPFQTLTLSDGDWALTGSPATILRVEDASPRGKITRATLELAPVEEANLLPNPSTWTDLSGPAIVSGNHNGGSVNSLVDTTKNFITEGVLVGHQVVNEDIRPTTEETVASISTTTNPNDTVTTQEAFPWAVNHAYRIFGTGTSTVTTSAIQLEGGTQGIGWREAPMVTTPGLRYQVTFRVRQSAASLMVGSASGLSDVLAEATYEVNAAEETHTASFQASSTTSYVAFRNNQDTTALVDSIEAAALGAAGFRVEDVGKFLTINNGTLQVTEFTSTGEVQALIEAPLDSTNTAVAGAWTLSQAIWSDARGYPQAGAYHQGRKVYAGTPANPLTVVLSRTGDFANFAIGADPNSALFYELAADQMNIIQWVISFQELVLGTQGSEHLVTAIRASLTPEDRVQIPLGNDGSAFLPPVRISNSVFFVQFGGRNVLEMQFTDEGRLLNTANMMILNEAISVGNIIDMAYQSQPHKIAWMVRGDGTLIGLTVEMIEEIRAWHQHMFDGEVLSVAVTPTGSQAGPETSRVWLAVRRSGGISIEAFRPRLETAASITEQLTVDDAVQYRGPETTTITGLDHLNGQTVAMVQRDQVMVGGILREKLANLGTQLVQNGQVTLDAPVTAVDVGLPLRGYAEIVPPEVPTQDGTLQGRNHHWSRFALRLKDGLGIIVNGKQTPLRVPEDLMDQGHVPRSRLVDIDVPGWDRENQIRIEQQLPFPVTILNIIGDLEWETVQ